MRFERVNLEQLVYGLILSSLALLSGLSYISSTQPVIAGTTNSKEAHVLAKQSVISDDPDEKRVIDHIQKIRQAAGKSQLLVDASLNEHAAGHAKHLSTVCGKQIHSNIKQYLGDVIDGGIVVFYGENLGLHQTSINSALDQLSASPSHYATMVGDYTHMGISVIHSDRSECGESYFIVQHFAKIL